MARVRGKTPKMSLPRYTAVMPNIGREVTFGQSSTSRRRESDHCSISSAIRGNLGRGRLCIFARCFMPQSRDCERAAAYRLLCPQSESARVRILRRLWNGKGEWERGCFGFVSLTLLCGLGGSCHLVAALPRACYLCRRSQAGP